MKVKGLRPILTILAAMFLLFATSIARADTIMYGGNGGQNNGGSINNGALVIIDQTTAAITVVGQPIDVSGISGLAFDSTGTLWGTTQPEGGFRLLRVQPG